MKARPVPKLDPEQSLKRNAARIIAVRLDEVCSFDPAIRDPANVEELHDMQASVFDRRLLCRRFIPLRAN